MTVIAIDTAVMGAVPLLVGVAAANDPPRGLAAAIGTALILPGTPVCKEDGPGQAGTVPVPAMQLHLQRADRHPGGGVWDAGQAGEPAE